MEVQTLYLFPPLTQLIRLHVANGESKPCICYVFSLNWLDYVLQMQVQHLYLLLPLVQLVRLHVANGGLNLVFVTPSHSIDQIVLQREVQTLYLSLPLAQSIRLRVCKWRSKPCTCFSLSLNWLDYMLQVEVWTLYLLLPLAQLIGLCVANASPNLVFVTSSRSIDFMTCCKWGSEACICHSFSLNRLDYVLQREVQTLYLFLPLDPLIRLHKRRLDPCICDSLSLNWSDYVFANGGPNLVVVTPSSSIDSIACCKWRSEPCMCFSLSLNRLDYVLQIEAQSLDSLVPLTELIRLHVANGVQNCMFVSPSRWIDSITCCRWSSKP